MRNSFKALTVVVTALLATTIGFPAAHASTSHTAIISESVNPGFSDLDQSDEYYDDIIACYQNGYMPSGYDLARLGTNKPVTRADMAGLLFGLSGEALDAECGTGGYSCSDIPDNASYSQAVDWAIKHNYMQRDNQDRFFPNKSVSRQEVASLLFSYESKYGESPALSTEEVDNILSTISDVQAITDDHREAVAWCIREGLFTCDGSFNPNANISKGEIAQAARSLQPRAITSSRESIIVPPVAIYYGGNKIDLAVRGFNAIKTTWEKRTNESESWETIEDNAAHIEVLLSEYCDPASTLRCTVRFAHGDERTFSLNEERPRLFNLVDTDQDYYSSFNDENGSLTLISFRETAELSVDTFKSSEFANVADKVKSIHFLGNFYAPHDARGLFTDSYSDAAAPLFPNLENANLANLNFFNSFYADRLFVNYGHLTTVTFGSLNTFDGLIMDSSFENCSNLVEVNFLNGCRLSSSANMFNNCEKLKTITSGHGDSITLGGNAQSTFENCKSLTEVPRITSDVNIRLNNVKRLFMGCASLKSLDLSGWDISSMPTLDQYSISTIDSIFSGCTNLKSLNLSNWHFSEPVSLTHAFEGCSSLEEINLAGWEKARFVNLTATFNECASLKRLNISNWNVERVHTATGTFNGCKALTSLNLSEWSTPDLRDSAFMFSDCPSLKYLDLGDINTSGIDKAYNMRKMFEGTPNLSSITLGYDFRFPDASIGFAEIPKDMCWRARNAGTVLPSTAALISHQNSRSYAGTETYILLKTTNDGSEEGSGGGTSQPSFPIVDNTNGKVEIGDFGAPSSSITRIETSLVKKTSAKYKVLASQIKENEEPCGAYSIAMSGKGKVVAIFNVSSKLNGQALRIVQLKEDGTITSSPAAVIDGSAVLIIDGSQSVMLLAPNDAEKPAATFSDVPTDAWYVTGGILDYSVSNDLLTGYGNGKFGPDDPFTRGQAITVLWRIAGCPSASAKAFSDVDYSQYYGKAINWARKTGVVSGYEDTNTFKPDVPASRAEIAAMLANYASIIESMDTSSDGGSLASKADAASVPEWARGVMGWAVDQGIISGRVIDGKEYLAPSEQTLRCEAAKMLVLFHRDTLHIKGGTEA